MLSGTFTAAKKKLIESDIPPIEYVQQRLHTLGLELEDKPQVPENPMRRIAIVLLQSILLLCSTALAAEVTNLGPHNWGNELQDMPSDTPEQYLAKQWKDFFRTYNQMAEHAWAKANAGNMDAKTYNETIREYQNQIDSAYQQHLLKVQAVQQTQEMVRLGLMTVNN